MTRPGYPRLGAGWRLVLGAAPLLVSATAAGDLTVTGNAKPPTAATLGEPQKPAAPKPGANDPQPPPEPHHRLGGKIACPKPPPARHPRANGGMARSAAPDGKWIVSSARGEGLVIHPHGPDEPCGDLDA